MKFLSSSDSVTKCRKASSYAWSGCCQPVCSLASRAAFSDVSDRAIFRQRPRADQGLVEQIFDFSIRQIFVSPALIHCGPTANDCDPLLWPFGQNRQSRPCVSAPFRVVGRCREHGRWPGFLLFLTHLMKTQRRDSELVWVAAHFIQSHETRMTIKCGVLHGFGHDGAGQLLETEHKVLLKLPASPQQKQVLDKIE